jgi:hypothetical protein
MDSFLSVYFLFEVFIFKNVWNTVQGIISAFAKTGI